MTALLINSETTNSASSLTVSSRHELRIAARSRRANRAAVGPAGTWNVARRSANAPSGRRVSGDSVPIAPRFNQVPRYVREERGFTLRHDPCGVQQRQSVAPHDARRAWRPVDGGADCTPVSDDDFKVELESEPDDVLTVRLDGELDMAHADWVDDTLTAASAHHSCVAVQLDDLSFIDSAGIQVLQSLKAKGDELGISVAFVAPSGAVQRALRAAGLTDLID
jgi:anti-anti-sigma factor